VRTPLTVFAIGAGGCIAMGMMMQHLLRVSQDRNQSPALQEINRVFGPRLEVVCRDLLGGTDERYSVGRPASLPGPRSKPAPVQSPQIPKSSAAPSSGSASRGSVAPAKIKDAVVPPAQPPQSPR
jgi:hypothetical protein